MNTLAPPTSPVLPITTDRAVSTLILSFAADPVVRWFYPDAGDYLKHFPQLVRLLSADSIDGSCADGAADGAAAALWVKPGIETDDDALGELIATSIPAARHEVMFDFLDQVGDQHLGDTHWYLPSIGVEPLHQGCGYGSALLDVGTARADRDTLPCYLEASSPRNRALYERHGFTVVGQIQAGDSPPLWPMVRPAAATAR